MAGKTERSTVELIINGDVANKTLRDLEAGARKLRSELRGMTEEELKANPQKIRNLKSITNEIDKQNLAIKGTSKSWENFKRDIASTATGVIGGNMIMGTFTAISAGISGSIKKAAELSDIFADVEKTTGMTNKEVEQLAASLSRIDTRTAKTDLLEIAKVAGQFGIAKDQVLGFVKAIDLVNVALGDEFQGGPEAIASEMSKLRNVFTDIKTQNIGADIKFIANVLNELGAAGVATGPVVADVANRIGGVGIQAGLTTAQVLGIAASVQELNISTERGSTAIVKILQKMLTDVETFAKIAGKPVSEFKKTLDTDLYSAFTQVLEGSRRVGTSSTALAGVIKELELQGAGASEVFAKFGTNVGLLNEKVALANGAINETNSITSEFNKKNENLAASIEKLDKKWSALWTNSQNQDFWKAIVKGGEYATDFIQSFIDWMQTGPNNFIAASYKKMLHEMDDLSAKYNEQAAARQEEYQVKIGRMKAEALQAEKENLLGVMMYYKATNDEMATMTLKEQRKRLAEIKAIRDQLIIVNAELGIKNKKQESGSAVAALSPEEVAAAEKAKAKREKEYNDTMRHLERLQKDADKLNKEFDLKRMSADEQELERIRMKYQTQIDEAIKYELKKDGHSEAFRQVRLQLEQQRDEELLIKKQEQEEKEDAERARLADKIYMETLSDQNREFAEISNHYEKLIIEAEKYGLDTTKLEQARNEALLGIDKKYREKDLAQQRESNKMQLEEEARNQAAQAQLVQNFGTATANFNRLIGTQEGELTEFQRMVTLTQIYIDTAAAISSVTAKNAASSLTPIDYALKVTAAVGTVFANMATAKEMLGRAKTPQAPSFSRGYKTGGFTAYSASDNTLVGGVHANEYVIDAESLRMPPVFNLAMALESYKRNGSNASSFSSPTATAPSPFQDGQMTAILLRIEQYLSTPKPAVILWNESDTYDVRAKVSDQFNLESKAIA